MSFYSSKFIKQPEKKKSPLGMILLLFVIALVGVGYYVTTLPAVSQKIDLYSCYWDSSISNAKYGENKTYEITIEEGSHIIEIGEALQDSGIIENPSDFACYANKINAGADIQAGYYEIQGPLSIEQLIPQLKYAEVPSLTVTIPEGLRMDEIGKILDEKFSKDNPINEFSYTEFLSLTNSPEILDNRTRTYLKGKKNVEGFLYPDTYQFSKNATARSVINKLLDTFEDKVTDTGIFQTDNPYNVVVLASILEKEAGRSYEEKRMIADILLKRMEDDYFLEVDAPFLYEKKDWKAPILATDKLSDSPYNMYRQKGLPPTPICNPGYDSVSAVLNRKANDYWFYLHGNDGKIHYGKTYTDHLNNIEQYLR